MIWRGTGSTTCLQPSTSDEIAAPDSRLTGRSASCVSVAAVVAANAPVKPPRWEAAVLESAYLSCTGMGRGDRASRINSLSPWTTRSPRLTWVSLGKPRLRLLMGLKARSCFSVTPCHRWTSSGAYECRDEARGRQRIFPGGCSVPPNADSFAILGRATSAPCHSAWSDMCDASQGRGLSPHCHLDNGRVGGAPAARAWVGLHDQRIASLHRSEAVPVCGRTAATLPRDRSEHEAVGRGGELRIHDRTG